MVPLGSLHHSPRPSKNGSKSSQASSRTLSTPSQLLTCPDIRFLTWFSPCIWGASDGYPTIRRLLHGTALGRALVDAFWASIPESTLGHHSNSYSPSLPPTFSP
jgi:hypothetical protein